LIQTTWTQLHPFDLLTPLYQNDETESGSSTVPGCLPLAISQVMNYYSYPKARTQVISAYTTSTHNIYVHQKDPMEYDWQSIHMANGIAMAFLTSDVGAALRADYDSDGTSASITEIPNMSTYFGYDPYMQIFLTDAGLMSSEFVERMYCYELEQGRPIIATGAVDAHAYIIDGYKLFPNGNEFHINWGFSDDYNGWYRVHIKLGLNDYSEEQAIVVNFKPKSSHASTYLYPVFVCKDFYIENNASPSVRKYI